MIFSAILLTSYSRLFHHALTLRHVYGGHKDYRCEVMTLFLEPLLPTWNWGAQLLKENRAVIITGGGWVCRRSSVHPSDTCAGHGDFVNEKPWNSLGLGGIGP